VRMLARLCGADIGEALGRLVLGERRTEKQWNNIKMNQAVWFLVINVQSCVGRRAGGFVLGNGLYVKRLLRHVSGLSFPAQPRVRISAREAKLLSPSRHLTLLMLRCAVALD
jgi:hypothetical protein